MEDKGPPVTSKYKLENMPKATQKSGGVEEGEEETTFHGAGNEKEEAQLQIQAMDTIIEDMASKIEGDPNAMKKAIRSLKEVSTMVMPGMEEVNPMVVLRTVRDTSCLAIHPYMEEIAERLKEVMPLVEIPRGESVAAEINKMEPLNNEQKAQIGELFEDMEIAHEHLACSCSLLGILSRSLKS